MEPRRLSYERHKFLQPSRSAIETHSRRCIIGAGCYCASGAATCIRSLPANRIDRPIDSEDVYLVGGYCEGLTFFSLLRDTFVEARSWLVN